MNAEDVVQIEQLIARYGHVVDDGPLDQLDEIFTADATFDQRRLGGVLQDGLEAIRTFLELPYGPDRPKYGIGHHTTNTYVYEKEGEVQVISKLLVVDATGQIHTGVYEDRVVRQDGGWRIAARSVRVTVPADAPRA
jgi:3-phenylpropionate/cinnamic acid dioxygenase small subunit